jgi:uncharacterized protein YecT (DUF1311 family)
MLIEIALLAALYESPAEANARVLQACMDDNPSYQCIGMLAEPCLSRAGYPGARLDCYDDEYYAWRIVVANSQEYMNDRYLQSLGEDLGGEAIRRMEAAQEAWRIARDADCAFANALNEGGDVGRLAEADCRLARTAERAYWIMRRG